MEELISLNELEDFAGDCISSKNHPDAIHRFSLYRCSSCRSTDFELTIEHHSGSETWSFRGIIWGRCSGCGYMMQLFTFTGEHREWLRDERPECDCGNSVFKTGQYERFEGELGIPGFFDEGVIVGRCTSCHRKKALLYTD